MEMTRLHICVLKKVFKDSAVYLRLWEIIKREVVLIERIEWMNDNVSPYDWTFGWDEVEDDPEKLIEHPPGFLILYIDFINEDDAIRFKLACA